MEEILEKPYVIGLDMGGTNSVFGIVDQRGTIIAQTAIKTQAYPDINDYVKAAVDALQPALDVVGGIDNIRGMGIDRTCRQLDLARYCAHLRPL